MRGRGHITLNLTLTLTLTSTLTLILTKVLMPIERYTSTPQHKNVFTLLLHLCERRVPVVALVAHLVGLEFGLGLELGLGLARHYERRIPFLASHT